LIGQDEHACQISGLDVISFERYCLHTQTHTHTELTALPGSQSSR